MYKLEVYQDKCHGCGNCVISCPVNAKDDNIHGGAGPDEDSILIMQVINGVVTLLNPDLCDGCGACVESCPVDAIKLVVE